VEIENFIQLNLRYFTLLMNYLITWIKGRYLSGIILLDLSHFGKAFDSIQHDLMLFKLCKAGVSETACAWFESYLSQRIQVVKIQNTSSHPLPVTVGVPQGSILGPVLFTLYVNDLLQVPKHCKALGYVDDTKLFLGFPSNQLHEIISDGS